MLEKEVEKHGLQFTEIMQSTTYYLYTRTWIEEELMCYRVFLAKKSDRFLCDLIIKEMGNFQVNEVYDWVFANLFKCGLKKYEVDLPIWIL